MDISHVTQILTHLGTLFILKQKTLEIIAEKLYAFPLIKSVVQIKVIRGDLIINSIIVTHVDGISDIEGEINLMTQKRRLERISLAFNFERILSEIPVINHLLLGQDKVVVTGLNCNGVVVATFNNAGDLINPSFELIQNPQLIDLSLAPKDVSQHKKNVSKIIKICKYILDEMDKAHDVDKKTSVGYILHPIINRHHYEYYVIKRERHAVPNLFDILEFLCDFIDKNGYNDVTDIVNTYWPNLTSLIPNINETIKSIEMFDCEYYRSLM